MQLAVRRGHFIRYARPSFFEGMARIIDFGNTLNRYPKYRSASEEDMLALRSDWLTVGDDIRAAISEFDETQINERAPVS